VTFLFTTQGKRWTYIQLTNHYWSCSSNITTTILCKSQIVYNSSHHFLHYARYENSRRRLPRPHLSSTKASQHPAASTASANAANTANIHSASKLFSLSYKPYSSNNRPSKRPQLQTCQNTVFEYPEMPLSHIFYHQIAALAAHCFEGCRNLVHWALTLRI